MKNTAIQKNEFPEGSKQLKLDRYFTKVLIKTNNFTTITHVTQNKVSSISCVHFSFLHFFKLPGPISERVQYRLLPSPTHIFSVGMK